MEALHDLLRLHAAYFDYPFQHVWKLSAREPGDPMPTFKGITDPEEV
jgi:hypothetical protein